MQLVPLISAHPPMRVAIFSSMGPGNLKAALDAAKAMPDLIEIALLVTDRYGIPAIDLANASGIPIISLPFGERLAGLTGPAKEDATRHLHDEILTLIQGYERRIRRIDLCVLAYRRIIRGNLYEYFRDRMINQHPADLTVFENGSTRRKYIGISGLKKSIIDGNNYTRTSTILVNEEIDAGEILVQGPKVKVDFKLPTFGYSDHEQKQKMESDWPALKNALKLLAMGAFAFADTRWEDGCRKLLLYDQPLPYSGVQL